jgi:hypothetical protein
MIRNVRVCPLGAATMVVYDQRLDVALLTNRKSDESQIGKAVRHLYAYGDKETVSAMRKNIC